MTPTNDVARGHAGRIVGGGDADAGRREVSGTARSCRRRRAVGEGLPCTGNEIKADGDNGDWVGWAIGAEAARNDNGVLEGDRGKDGGVGSVGRATLATRAPDDSGEEGASEKNVRRLAAKGGDAVRKWRRHGGRSAGGWAGGWAGGKREGGNKGGGIQGGRCEHASWPDNMGVGWRHTSREPPKADDARHCQFLIVPI